MSRNFRSDAPVDFLLNRVITPRVIYGEMRRTVSLVVALVAALHVIHEAAAAGPVPFPRGFPPRPGGPVRSAPRNANAGIRRYDEFKRARVNVWRINRSVAPAALVTPTPLSPAFPWPQYYVIGDELPATPANAERYVALAHRAMASCIAMQAAAADYRGALTALNAKQYRIAMAASRNTVDDCTGTPQ